MTAEEVLASTRSFLRQFDDGLAADLTTIARTPLPPPAVQLDFEVHIYDDEFSVVGFNMDRSANQHGGNHYLLRAAERSWPAPLAKALDGGEDDAAGRIVFAELISWLADGWAKAGGQTIGVSAYACRHDDLKSYDLAARNWIDSEAKWG